MSATNELGPVGRLLDKPEKWTQGNYAYDADGFFCAPDSPSAVCFCILGAIRQCYGDQRKAFAAERKLARAIGLRTVLGLAAWNDFEDRKFSDIKKAVRKAGI